MGFFDTLGKYAAKVQAKVGEINLYQQDYANLSPRELYAEYKRLIEERDAHPYDKEIQTRLQVAKVLLERMRENGEI